MPHLTDRLERGHEALGRSSNPNPRAWTWWGLETPALQEGATCQRALPAPAPGGVHARVSKGSEPGRRADDPGKKGAVWGLGPGLSLACGIQGGAGPRDWGHRALGVSGAGAREPWVLPQLRGTAG